jgi:GT2 family glycosyltransferase
MKKVSIVIPTYNHLDDYLKPCLESIQQYTDMEMSEVIVVANGCTDGTRAYVESLGKDFKLIWFDEAMGFTKSTNAGIRESVGEYIVLLNNDIVLLGQPKNCWIDILEAPFVKDKNTGITGPVKFSWPCGNVKKTAIAFWCAMISRRLIEDIGILDEIYSPGMGEDGDFSIRAEVVGYKLVQVPVEASTEFGKKLKDHSFPIYHKGSGTFGNMLELGNDVIAKNNKVLANKFNSRLEIIFDTALYHECDINELFPILRRYASRCNHITEFGVRGVFSTYAFLASKPKKMISYDIYTSTNIKEACDVSKENNIDFKFVEKNVLETQIEETDLLFLDTRHTYYQLSQELKLHAGKVRKYILMHDTFTFGEKDEIEEKGSEKHGLSIAIKEFLEENPHWKMIEKIDESNGLTILERKPDISIIIPTHNHLEDALKHCLKSVFDFTNMINKEIIVVANGCNDGTEEYIKQEYKNKVKLIILKDAVGYIAAVNSGAKIVSGDYLVLLDNDCILLGQERDMWINMLLEPFKKYPDCGMSGPFFHDYEFVGKIIHSGCAMYQKDVWDKVDGFDPIFTYGYFSDPDISLRIQKAGYKIVEIPEGSSLANRGGFFIVGFPIYHPIVTTTMSRDKNLSLLRKNRDIFFDRHRKRPKFSIVIPTYNHAEDFLKPCLESVKKYTNLEDVEIIVVANGCKDNTAEVVDFFGYPFKLLWSDEQLGFVKATNLGIQKAIGEYVILLNNDCVLPEQKCNEWIDIMFKPFSENVEVGITGPLKAMLWGNVNRSYLMFFCAMIDRKIFDKIGLLDEVFGMGSGEDMDFCFKAEDVGYKVLQVPSNILQHEPGFVGGYPIRHDHKDKDYKFDYENNCKIIEERYGKKGKKIKTSIIVPTYNHLEDCLKPCLESIKKYTNLDNVEVVVVANGCTDGTKEYVESLDSSFNLVWRDHPLGYPRAINLGVESSLGENIVLLNNDCVLLGQGKDWWLDRLISPLKDKLVGITGVSQKNSEHVQIDFLIFFCVAMRKEVFLEIGKLDEIFTPGYGEDTDFCIKLKKAGYEMKLVAKRLDEVNYISDFPIYHAAERTVHGMKEWANIVQKNANILKSRYKKEEPKKEEPKKEKIKISVVIPTYNHLDDCLKPCLESIIKYTDFNNVDMEVLVVANGCKDKTKEYVESLGKPFRLIWSDEGLGFTKATNLGIKEATGNYIILLNNDCKLLDMYNKNIWIDMLLAPFLKDEKVGITGPLKLFDRYANSDVMIFFCVMIKKELFDKLGLLDEVFSPGGGEDIDFCVKALNAGYTQVVVPDGNTQFTFTNVGGFPIYHMGEGTLSEKEFPEYSKSIIKRNGTINMVRYNKHIKLNIGSGGVEVPGYLSLDKFDTRALILMDAMDLELPDNSVEEILASHFFEHVNPYNAVDLLKKWNKVLKPGGKLIMEVPNIEEQCKDFVTADKQARYGILNVIYGSVNTKDDKVCEITSPHLWGWYPEMMIDHLTWAGFKNIKIMPEQIPHPHKNFRVEAVKGDN